MGKPAFRPIRGCDPLALVPIKDWPVSAPAGLQRVWKNSSFVVQEYRHSTEWGAVRQLMIRRNDAQPVRDWYDLQRIKNEIAGVGATAIEV